MGCALPPPVVYVPAAGAFVLFSKNTPHDFGACISLLYLFIIVMSVLLEDAVGSLSASARAAYEAGDLADLVYADDTLIIGIKDEYLNEYLRAVQLAGNRYGMELHAQKFQLLSTDPRANIRTPDGAQVPLKPHIDYLGATLSADGSSDHELNRRIGLAKLDFLALSKVWSHSSLTWRGKLRVFSAVVESKLMYSLGSICLKAAAARRLDGFQNRCIRKIVGIKPAFISRVSNKDVLARAGHRAASQILRERRLQLFGKVLRAPHAHPMRQVCFIEGTSHPATERFVRRVGRPCKEWVQEQLSDVTSLFGSIQTAMLSVANKHMWNSALREKLGCEGGQLK